MIGLVSLFVACTGEEESASRGTPSEAPPRAPASVEAPKNEVITRRIDVAGVVASDLAEPIVGRSLVLVDSRGARHELVTGGDGSFVVPAVLPPYDVAVVPASGPVTVHLGLYRSNPWIELFEREGPTPSPESRTIRVHVRAPACDAPSCWITAMTASPAGSGSTTAPCEPGADVTVVDVDHRWRGPSVPPGDRIDVHVLVGGAGRSSFAYGRVDAVAAAADTVDVGMIEPAPVPATDPISMGVEGGAGALTDWRWSTSVFLDLSGDSIGSDTGFLFMVAPAATTTVRAPLLPGVRMFANIAASHPRADGQGGFHRSAEVWSGARALSVDPIMMEIAAGPEIVRPASGGTLSRRGLGFEWRSLGIAALSTLTVADTTRGSVRFRVSTTAQEVPFARLARLGLPKLELGDHVLDLSTAPRASADDAVSPDSLVRRQRSDRSRPGMTTYLRIPFQITN